MSEAKEREHATKVAILVETLSNAFSGKEARDVADAIEALCREIVREEMDLQALRMEQSARVVEVQELQRSEGHVAEPPADKLTRDRSTPENAAWWDAIVEAAESAPRITVAEPPVLMCEWCGATKAENCCQHMYNEPPAGVHEKLSALRPEDLLSSEQRIGGDRVLREMQRARSVKYAVECQNCFGRGCSRCHGIGLETAEPPAGGQRRCDHKEPDMDCFLCRHEALSEPQPSAEAEEPDGRGEVYTAISSDHGGAVRVGFEWTRDSNGKIRVLDEFDPGPSPQPPTPQSAGPIALPVQSVRVNSADRLVDADGRHWFTFWVENQQGNPSPIPQLVAALNATAPAEGGRADTERIAMAALEHALSQVFHGSRAMTAVEGKADLRLHFGVKLRSLLPDAARAAEGKGS